MNQQRALVVLVLVGLGLLFWAFLYTRDAKKDQGISANSPTTELPRGDQMAATIFKRSYEAGTHTWSGSVMLPNPCVHLNNPDVSVAESYPEQVRITLTSTPQTKGEVCAAVVTENTFTATFTASQEATVSVTLDGEPLTIIFADTTKGTKTLPEGMKPTLVQ